MKISRICFQIGSWSFIILGLGHMGTHLATMLDPAPQPPVIQAMQAFITPLPGREVDLLSLHNGFSLTMGILLIAVGGLNLLFLRSDTDFPLLSKTVVRFDVCLSAIILWMSFQFFFAVPVLFSLISLVFYIVVILLPGKTQRSISVTS